MRHTLLIVIAVVASLSATRAQAAPIDDAKKAFAEGKAAFERGDYEKALSAYQTANLILPAPNLYYNIGATYEKLGRYQEAARAFDKYFETAGAPTSDEDRDFQDKLRARAEADRKRPVVTVQQQQSAIAQPPPTYYAPPPNYYQPYGVFPPQVPREERLRLARARRTRAIVLMAIGVPMAVVGITLLAYSSAIDVNNSTGAFYGDIFAGVTLTVVGVTLFAPGAGSYVRSSRDIRELTPPTFNGAR